MSGFTVIFLMIICTMAGFDMGKNSKKDKSKWTQEEKERKIKENEQIEKIQSAKTGEPITLSGYRIVDSDGKDTGKRFIRKEDAEEYMKRQHQE